MIKQEVKKKLWKKPTVNVLSIKKDTFSGSQVGVELADKSGPPTKS